MSLSRARRMRLRDFSCIKWFPPALDRRTRPEPEMRKRFLALLLVFILGMAGGLSDTLRARSQGEALTATPLACYGKGPCGAALQPAFSFSPARSARNAPSRKWWRPSAR